MIIFTVCQDVTMCSASQESCLLEICCVIADCDSYVIEDVCRVCLKYDYWCSEWLFLHFVCIQLILVYLIIRIISLWAWIRCYGSLKFELVI